MINFNAIRHIYPDAKFTMINDDPSTIVWFEEEFPIPTQLEIDQATQEIEELAQIKANALESALSKLQALGLTLDEAKAIGGIK